MSGFEVVGIVLGSIPLLFSALEHYERGIKTIQIVRRRAKVMHSLATALSTERTILRNTCETLLGGIIDPKDMKPLLAEPFGPLWQDPDTKVLVERRLDHTLNDFKALVHSMEEVVEEIRSKLGRGLDCEIRIDDSPIGKRDMIKIALQFSTHEDSLKRLSDINQKLDLMMNGNLRNEPYRKVPSQENLFNLLQAVSRSIYSALRSSLSCTCAQAHRISFGLPTPRVTGRVQDEEALVKRLNFHLILTNRLQDAKGKAHSSWVWDELILRLAEIPMKVCATAVLPTITDVVAKKSCPCEVLGDSATCASEGHLSHVKRQAARYQMPGLLRGYLLDETTQKRQRFEVFPFISPYDNNDCTTIHLRDAFSQRYRPSLARKYHIAAAAASSVLFMNNTLWMPSTLTIKDVFLISRHGNVDFDEIYLAKKSLHDPEGSTIAPNQDPSSEAAGMSTLYYLGIFLVEVMLWKPLQEFWDDEGVDLNSIQLEDIFDYTTTKGFARIEGILKRIEWISSSEFREVVEHCIKCDLRASSFFLDNDDFRQAVYSDIVLPLQDIDRLAGGKMTAGKGKDARTA
ncbi:hypothetical protein CHU98_g1520 [Xylaria longipes]|nr:hypothetical protein CHU98_g1520 [Xylaria longipes]